MYLHVRLDYYDTKLKANQTLYEFDYDNDNEIIQNIISKKLSGRDIVFKGVLLNAEDVRQIQIYCTNDRILDTVKRANDENPGLMIGYSCTSVLKDQDYCNDVTRQLMDETLDFMSNIREISSPFKVEKKPMVFISHSSKDFMFVQSLTDMLIHIGLTGENLFCSSIPTLWLKLSDDIFDSLRKLFQDHDIFVIFVQSPRYYESSVSLNEMGAAWVLQSKYCSILTKDMEYNQMTGVIDKSKIAFKVNDPNARFRLNDLKDEIYTFLGLDSSKLDATRWEYERDRFLREVTE